MPSARPARPYVASQKAEGWILVPDRYDDGGFSGGTLDRPALKRLLAISRRAASTSLSVYKIDRLSRSLMDFAKLVEVFDRNSVTFVSVTQAFNTTTSMGRLTLNILLSFAQFEREVIGERIRDKFAASRKKGMWMGGLVPLGYRVKDRSWSSTRQRRRSPHDLRAVRASSAPPPCWRGTLSAERHRPASAGKPIDKGYLYKLLNNRVYIGEAVHKGTAYPGEHKAIIDRQLWDKVHAILRESPRTRRTDAAQTPALLKGLIFGPRPRHVAHPHAEGRQALPLLREPVGHKGRCRSMPGRPVPAAEIEAAVVDQLGMFCASPEIIVRTWRAARQ